MILWLLLAAAAGVAILLGWMLFMRSVLPPAPVNVSVPAVAAGEIRAIPKTAVAIRAPVKVYRGGAPLKRRLNLPQPVADNAAQQVIAASQVRADDHPQTITTLINTETGDSETYVRRDPLPWLAWDARGEAAMYVGIQRGGPALRLEARQGMVQIKALHVGVIGSVDQPLGGAPRDTDYFIGAGVWAKW
ncbi:hypothetical protein SFMTTN_2074 [Sulfuriferula multivorans]|uniref:Uncharacterized protein n=1 Tax=Sulfuriferula multivorans TaxID=1559896 RepID=A0A401JF51_9PROT|nr:hypothetical protein SFMTTN_2074 [Sulfuriferula multivorans]